MALIKKKELLHPIRIQAIEYGLTNMCEACTYSIYSSEKHTELKFDVCTHPCTKPNNVKSDCSYFEFDNAILDEEERKYYEEKGICWS